MGKNLDDVVRKLKRFVREDLDMRINDYKSLLENTPVPEASDSPLILIRKNLADVYAALTGVKGGLLDKFKDYLPKEYKDWHNTKD